MTIKPPPHCIRQRRRLHFARAAVLLPAHNVGLRHARVGRDFAESLSPLDGQLLDFAVAALELAYARYDEGFWLAGVKVTLLALDPAVEMRSPGFIREVGPQLSLLKNNFKHHVRLCEKKADELMCHGDFSPRNYSYGTMFFMVPSIHPRMRILRQLKKSH